MQLLDAIIIFAPLTIAFITGVVSIYKGPDSYIIMDDNPTEDKIPVKFLTDKVLNDVTEDKFGHKDLAQQLFDIIEEKNTPLHIGIFGQWGTGKTSIIKLYKDQIESKLLQDDDEDSSEKFKFITIPVWKYTKEESLRNKFVIRIAEDLDLDLRELNEKVYASRSIETPLIFSPEFMDEFKNFNKHFPWKWFVIGSVVMFLALGFVIYLLKDFDLKSISDLYYTLFTSVTVPFVISLGNFFKRALNVASKKVSYARFDSDEQFEDAFVGMMKKKKCKKIIFIDDLDRCTHKQVIRTLETIKTFLDIEGCIFLIACDPAMIRRAVIESNEILGYSEKDGAYYLEKFFHHTISIPPIIPHNMREFARDIVEEAPLTIIGDITKNALDQVLYVLAYSDVINPRKIIVLINSFIVDFYIAQAREDGEDPLLSGAVTDHPQVLAIMTILKHDFPYVFKDLTKFPRLLQFIKEDRINDEYNTQDEMIKRYTLSQSIKSPTKEGDKSKNKKYEPTIEDKLNLKKFLLSCNDAWIKEDVTPFLYLTLNESISALNNIVDNPKELDTAIRNNDSLTILEALTDAEGAK